MVAQLHNIADMPTETTPVNTAKEGVFYDDCPNPECGNRDVDLKFKSGGVTQKSQERYHDWSVFHCGCCGSNWTRTTKQGAARNEANGVATKALESSAAVGRTTFIMGGSPAFRDNYDRIFKKGAYAE